ncbi:MAG: hypothetical protein ACOC20_04090 [Oceanicaulis sp.]
MTLGISLFATRFAGKWSALADLAAGLVTIWIADWVLVIPGGFLLSIAPAPPGGLCKASA